MRAVIRRYSVCIFASTSELPIAGSRSRNLRAQVVAAGRWQLHGEGQTRNKWSFCGCSNTQASSFPASPTSTTTTSRLPLVGVGTPDFSKRRRLFVCIQRRRSDGSPAQRQVGQQQAQRHADAAGLDYSRVSGISSCLHCPASSHHVQASSAGEPKGQGRAKVVELVWSAWIVHEFLSLPRPPRPMTRRR